MLDAGDHDLGGFDEGGGGVAFFEMQLADGVGGDDGGDGLLADAEDDAGEEAVDGDVGDDADELVAAADLLTLGAAGFGGLVGLEGAGGDAVVAARGLDGGEGAAEDPLLDGGIADAEEAGGFAWGEEIGLR